MLFAQTARRGLAEAYLSAHGCEGKLSIVFLRALPLDCQ